jgi:Adenylate and Guanylate cyclase catalytic domain.
MRLGRKTRDWYIGCINILTIFKTSRRRCIVNNFIVNNQTSRTKDCHLSYKACRRALQIGSRFCFQLLLKPKFSGIEKIKTIGSTYMLASGLRPGKEDGMGVSLILLLTSK